MMWAVFKGEIADWPIKLRMKGNTAIDVPARNSLVSREE